MDQPIQNDDLVGLPTDTVYGIGCLAQSTEGVKKIYELKGRSQSKPISICVGDLDQISEFGETWHLPTSLLETLFPGKITIVVKRKPILNPELNPGSDKVGIRIPDSNLIRGLARNCGAIALTSANISGQPSSTRVEQFEQFLSSLVYVVDVGELQSNKGSTVVDLSQVGKFRVLRDGDECDRYVECLTSYGIEQCN